MPEWHKSYTNYGNWLSDVDGRLRKILGAPSDMLPDWDWAAAFDADLSPVAAVNNYFEVIDTL